MIVFTQGKRQLLNFTTWLASIVLCSEERVCVMMGENAENLAMRFPIEKIINTKLFIDRTVVIYIGETQIIEGTSEGGDLLEDRGYLVQKW